MHICGRWDWARSRRTRFPRTTSTRARSRWRSGAWRSRCRSTRSRCGAGGWHRRTVEHPGVPRVPLRAPLGTHRAGYPASRRARARRDGSEAPPARPLCAWADDVRHAREEPAGVDGRKGTKARHCGRRCGLLRCEPTGAAAPSGSMPRCPGASVRTGARGRTHAQRAPIPHTHAHTHTRTHKHAQAHTHKHTHTHTQTHTRARAHTHSHTHTQTRTHTHTHTHTYRPTHTRAAGEGDGPAARRVRLRRRRASAGRIPRLRRAETAGGSALSALCRPTAAAKRKPPG